MSKSKADRFSFAVEEELRRYRTPGGPPETWSNMRECTPVTVALVGCSKTKRTLVDAMPAKHLYIGQLCKFGYRYATQEGWDVHFLSALYGLVEPTRPLTPYDMSMMQLRASERRDWGRTVVSSLLSAYPLVPLHLVLLAGRVYIEPILEAAAQQQGYWTFDLPLEGMNIFERLSWYKAQLEGDHVP